MNKTYIRIMAAATERQLDTLKDIKEYLVHEIETMDQFLADFLAKYDLDRRKKTQGNWTLYTKKIAEYGEVEDNLKVVNYYLEKFNV